mgnify:CR=1 FL=1
MATKLTLFFLALSCLVVFPQPRLEITPDDIEFEDIFHRNKNVYFINTGNAPLRIDSMVYKRYNNYYFLRFDRPWEYPVILQPNDSAKMDCILESYVYVPAVDTSDTLFIYNNGTKPIEKLKIKIKYFDDDYGRAVINGFVTSDSLPVDSAKVYFLYENNYIIASAVSNQNGFYEVRLPPGQYAVAVEKDSYYVSFYQNQYDPINADLITLKKDSVKTINLQIQRTPFISNSVSGVIIDSVSFAKVKKGLVIVRTGIHSPNKISAETNNKILQNGIYTAFIKQDGSYRIPGIIGSGYYYVQAFSNYYLPSFYNNAGLPAVFWQQADSILINGALSNINILMKRDSSVGGGIITGSVILNFEMTNRSDVLVYAKSTDNGLWYNYAYLKRNSEFKLTNLPYSNYKLYAQKIGYNDGVSIDLQISPTSTIISGVNIPIILSSAETETSLPSNFYLYQNYPNPFNPTTKIRYSIPNEETVVAVSLLKIYDILGNEIATLVNEKKKPGYYEVEWDASSTPSGVYIYRLTHGKFSSAKKMILVR